MNLSRDILVGLVRHAADTSVERVAVATALVNADWLIDVFVQEARSDGVSWNELSDVMGSSGGDGAGDARPGRVASVVEPSRGATRSHDGKYRPLWKYLSELQESRLQMSFDDVERILGFPLPPSSRHHQPHWYGYKGSAVARAIIDAGWKAQNVDLVREQVTFVRATAR